MKRKLFLGSTIICLSCVSQIALSRGALDAHTHGIANLTVAFVKGTLEIIFDTPAISVLGFEHRPTTRPQVEKVTQAKAVLDSLKNIISINGVDCRVETTEVTIIGLAAQTLDSDAEHHDHTHHHEDHDSLDGGHSEVSANYTLDCVGNESDLEISTLLFERFPGIEKIQLNWVTETKQGADVLIPQSTKIELR